MRRTAHFALPLLLLIATGCHLTPLEIPVASELATTTPLPVHQSGFPPWSAPLSFGRWTTTDFYRNSDRVHCFGFIAKQIADEERYHFSLSDAGEELHVECKSGSATSGLDLGRYQEASQEYPRLQCAISGAATGMLSMQTPTPGVVTLSGRELEIRTIDRDVRGIPGEHPLGYEILDHSTVVAAVKTVNDRSVRMTSVPADEAFELAAVAATLLLYAPHDADIDKDCNE
jgi:hypothetical protein